ncbi:MAG: glycerophosphodiester phosphodiesterase family protein [Pirellulales bacterium]
MSRIKLTFIVWGVLTVAGLDKSSLAADATLLPTAAQRVSAPGIRVIAHRGDSKVAPENTLPAFVSAVQAGSDLVELDYLHSADGVPVVFHDDKLDRTTDACTLWGGEKIMLGSKTLSELRTLDAGKWFAQQFAGTRIPTLDQALDAIQAGSMTLIERKEGDPATCVELLRSKNLRDRVVVQAFDWDYLEGCHELDKELVIAALGHKEVTPEKLDDVARTGCRVIAWEDKFTDASTIQAIHDRGYKAWVWTVDDPHRVAELVAAKIDGIITNVPAKTRAAVQSVQAVQ